MDLKNFNLLENVRCSNEIWEINGITLEDALEKSKLDPHVKALHWYKKKGGDSRILGNKGWYQGAGGDIGTIKNNDWDTIVLKKEEDNYILNINKIPNELFYCKNKDTYPPFKNGLYLEEYFLEYIQKNKINTKRIYIPALWTNFQIRADFNTKKEILQEDLDKWVKNNPSNYGYYCVIQHDDGSYLKLPNNTIVYNSGNNGDFPIPLIYEDKNNTLQKIQKKSFREKHILCSFVGSITSNNIKPNVRKIMINKFKNNKLFKILYGSWNCAVNTEKQKKFIDTTVLSKFSLCPRGYGRTSFRFFECFLLGTIPVYIWNDKNWLPFQNIIDYNKLCIVIHISEIDSLENKLKNITENKYNSMLDYYEKIKYLFELEGMTKQIISEIETTNIKNKFSLCIPTMDRYNDFLSINLPEYINNPFIDEIIISDENGNDITKIKKYIKNLNKFKFNINKNRLGAFYNKLMCCKLAKNEWIAIIDSDNFADINYFKIANDFLKTLINKNIILAPSAAKPHFDFSMFSGKCLKKGNFKNIPNLKNNGDILINTGNYIINKYLIDNFILSDEDKILIENSNACDVILFNTLLFEKLNLNMYVVPNLYYNHTIHKDSTYLNYYKRTQNTIQSVHKKYYNLLDNNNYIPVVIIHRTYKDYLKKNLEITSKNNKVYLIGDCELENLGLLHNVIFVNINKYENLPLIKESYKNFINYSSNNKKFEWGCFERVFILKYFMNEYNINKIFHIDSDNILLEDINNYIFEKDIAYCICKNWHKYHMCASIHSSLLNINFCNKFIDLFNDLYINKNKFYLIKDKIKYHKNSRGEFRNGGICDMTLYYILQKEKILDVQNLLIPKNNSVFINTFSGGEGYESLTQFELNNSNKNIIKDNIYNKYIIKDIINNRKFQLFNIHFQGNTKKFLNTFQY